MQRKDAIYKTHLPLLKVANKLADPKFTDFSILFKKQKKGSPTNNESTD